MYSSSVLIDFNSPANQLETCSLDSIDIVCVISSSHLPFIAKWNLFNDEICSFSEFRIFIKIVIPLAIPGIATIALFSTLAYWNDWFNAMLYIDSNNLIPVQYLLIKLETSMEFLSNNATSMGANAIEVASKMPKETAKMAIVVITTLPIIFAYPFFQRYFVSGLTIGSVKE